MFQCKFNYLQQCITNFFFFYLFSSFFFLFSFSFSFFLFHFSYFISSFHFLISFSSFIFLISFFIPFFLFHFIFLIIFLLRINEILACSDSEDERVDIPRVMLKPHGQIGKKNGRKIYLYHL